MNDLIYPRSRRELLRALGALGLSAAALSATPALDALAGITWCRTDPIVTINGKSFHIYVLSTDAMYDSATGPTEIIVKYPSGATASGQLLPNDNGFGHGYNLNLQATSGLGKGSSSIQVKVAVRIGAMDSSLPVRMEANRVSNGALVGSAQASANNWFESAPFWI